MKLDIKQDWDPFWVEYICLYLQDLIFCKRFLKRSNAILLEYW
jgi:hypothetical protein